MSGIKDVVGELVAFFTGKPFDCVGHLGSSIVSLELEEIHDKSVDERLHRPIDVCGENIFSVLCLVCFCSMKFLPSLNSEFVGRVI